MLHRPLFTASIVLSTRDLSAKVADILTAIGIE